MSEFVPASSARDSTDRAWMRRALALARGGWGQTAPNPMVGAVVVRGGDVVGEGFHARFGEAHAEVVALSQAGAAAHGATMYVTLEPCNHIGKTPPCTDALIGAGISRVVAALRDPNPAAAGGAEHLKAAGIEVEFGLEELAARDLNAPFLFAASGATRPWVTLKLAVSRDGAIADATRRQRWLTGEGARQHVHHLRVGHDAVAVGIGTALADDPALTVRHCTPPRVAPLRVVFDRRARLPVESKLVRGALKTPVVVLASEPDSERAAELRRSGVRVESVAGPFEGLQALYRQGVRSLLVEGGAKLAASLMENNLVDRLIIFESPVLLGEGSLPAFAGAPPLERWRIVERRQFGDDVMTEYAIHEP